MTLHDLDLCTGPQATMVMVFSAQHSPDVMDELLGLKGLKQALSNSTLKDQDIVDAIRKLNK